MDLDNINMCRIQMIKPVVLYIFTIFHYTKKEAINKIIKFSFEKEIKNIYLKCHVLNIHLVAVTAVCMRLSV
jgi:hypothetical protein